MPVFSKSILVKFIECVLAGLAIVNIYNSLIVYLVANSFANVEKIPDSMRLAGLILFICLAVFALFYPVYWHLKEKKTRSYLIPNIPFLLWLSAFG